MQVAHTLIRLYVAFWLGNPAGFLFLHALFVIFVASVIFDAHNRVDLIGWCSSCDKVWEEREFFNTMDDCRAACPNCGDWLVFADRKDR